MILPALDALTQDGLDSLPVKDILSKENYPYAHSIAEYGITAMAHAYLMHQAKENFSNGKKPEEFADRYCILKGNYQLESDLRAVGNEGIFIPKHAYDMGEGKRTVKLFSSDYHNIFARNPDGTYSFVTPPKTDELMIRQWQIHDFANIELVMRGILFGKEMWKICVADYLRYLSKFKQTDKITKPAEELIAYYSELLESC